MVIRRLVKAFFFSLILLIRPFIAESQVRILVSAPKLLNPKEGIYMACNLNQWNPRNENFKLKKLRNGDYFIDLPDTSSAIEFKFTQGSWHTVEGTEEGEMLRNHRVELSSLGTDKVIRTQIAGWEKRTEYEFTITHVPANTPEDASIYVAGNFNNWLVRDPNCKAEKVYDGTYKLKVFSNLEQLEFKFNRGGWESAEGRKDGRPIKNRTIEKKQVDESAPIDIKIETWEDFTSPFNAFSIIDLLLLFAAFQGILTSIALFSIQDFNEKANKWLVLLTLVSAFLILVKVLAYHRAVANTFPKLILLPYTILFTFGPGFYFYVRRLLLNETYAPQKVLGYFVPFFIQVTTILPFLLMEGKSFQFMVINEGFLLVSFMGINGILGWVFNAYLWVKTNRVVQQYDQHYQLETAYLQNISYLKTVQIIQVVLFCMGILTSGLFTLQHFFGYPIAYITDRSIDAIWLVFSLMGYFLGYYAINQPEIFKLKPEVQVVEKEIQPSNERAVPLPRLDELKKELEKLVAEKKVYKNPSLSINDLVEVSGIPQHILSRVINEGFEKNFFDFVNSYRVQEFMKSFEDAKNKHFTILGIAMDVGFNSKSSFNRAFKKYTGKTPTEYYQKHVS